MALGFIQCHLIRQMFRQLRDSAPVDLHALYTYFELQWLGNTRLQMWNVYDADVRTNNSCEGWHNRFNIIVNRHHPNIWQLLKVILEEHDAVEIARRQIAAGQTVVREVRANKVTEQRIATMKARYQAGSIDIIQYLDGIAHNLKAI